MSAVAVALLLVARLLTVATLTMSVGAPGATVVPRTIVIDPRAGMSTLTTGEPVPELSPQVAPPEPVHVHVWATRPAGTGSATVTSCAIDGPALDVTIV